MIDNLFSELSTLFKRLGFTLSHAVINKKATTTERRYCYQKNKRTVNLSIKDQKE